MSMGIIESGEYNKVAGNSDSTKEYIRNQNILSDYEAITLPFTAQYDGKLIVNTLTNSGLKVSINGVNIADACYSQGTSVGNSISLAIKKGDIVSSGSTNYLSAFVRFYKLRDYTGR